MGDGSGHGERAGVEQAVIAHDVGGGYFCERVSGLCAVGRRVRGLRAGRGVTVAFVISTS